MGGDYIYVIGPETAAHGVWRTVLTVTSGEAQLYLAKGDPSVPQMPDLFSTQTGNDAVLVPQEDYSVGQGWYIRVNATPGATWTLVSGDIDVTDWGTVDATADTSSAVIGPEGMLWFKVIMDPAQVDAWGIMEKSYPVKAMYVSRGRAPLVFGSNKIAEQKEEKRGQMVATPSGVSPATYYLGVKGVEGSTVDLNSFKHKVLVPATLPPSEYTDQGDDNFAFTLTGQSSFAINTGVAAGFRYVTYKVDVPANGLGWQVKMTPGAGSPDVYLRYARAATPNDNDAMSELADLTTDNAVIVPPDLNTGPSYITVYSPYDYFTFSLKSGDPEVTVVPFINESPNQIVNAPANQNTGGWVYYRVDNIAEQLNYIGWELLLSKESAGSELAIRRNAIPAYGSYRTNAVERSGAFNVTKKATTNILQDPDHAADIWYIGVYNKTTALGAFELITRAPQRSTLAFNGGSVAVGAPVCDAASGQSADTTRFFKVTVPAGALGWDMRLSNITGGDVRLNVRRGQLPNGWTSIPSSNKTSEHDHWGAGEQFGSQNGDYTDDKESDGTSADGRYFTVGMGKPLEPGDYYVAVGLETPTTTGHICYTITSRGIGVGNDAGGNPYAIQVQDLPLNGTASATLASRDIAVYRTVVPANTPGWMLKLEPDAGQEAMLAVGRNGIPNNTARADNGVLNVKLQGTAREQQGADYFYLFGSSTPQPDTTYYAVVESEGAQRTPEDRVATGSTHFTLTSAAMPYVDTTGNPLAEGETKSWLGQALPYGEMHLYRIRPVPGLASMEIRLKNRVGAPMMLVNRANTDEFKLPNQKTSTPNDDVYPSQDKVFSGYTRDFVHPDVINVPMPTGDYWVLVANKRATGAPVQGGYDLEITGKAMPDLPFNGGSAGAIDVPASNPQPANTWRYYRVVVPANAVGWDVRLTNVTSGEPRLVIRRDVAPTVFTGTGITNVLFTHKTWPSGAQMAVIEEYTDKRDGTGLLVDERFFTVGMNAPLQPGTYIVGVSNDFVASPQATDNMVYSIQSRGIGELTELDADGKPWQIPVTPLNYNGGSSAGSVGVRDLAVYRVDVPAATGSLELILQTASGHEALMAIGKGTLPNPGATNMGATTSVPGVRRDKSGSEFFYKFPVTAGGTVDVASYFIAVVGEGQGSTDTRIRTGTGNADYLISSKVLPLPTTVYVEGDTPWANQTLAYGQVKTYKVTLPSIAVTEMCISTSANVGFILGNNTSGLAALGNEVAISDDLPYDQLLEGGVNRLGYFNGAAAVIPNPVGEYFLTVSQQKHDEPYDSPVQFDINFDCEPIPELAFNGGAVDDAVGTGGGFQWYHVTVPANATGWDLRLVNVDKLNATDSAGGEPHLVIRRDQKPVTKRDDFSQDDTTWPSGDQWYADTDFTAKDNEAGAATWNDSDGRFFTAGMGAPLEPGSYYVGVMNESLTYGAKYRIVSRGIGEPGTLDEQGNPWLIPVQTLAFAGGSVAGSLPPVPQGNSDGVDDLRNIAVYKVAMPANVSAWNLELTPSPGHEAMLAVRRGTLPNTNAGKTGTSTATENGRAENNDDGAVRERVGKEYFYQFASRDAATATDRQHLMSGDYYVVVGEGQNPVSASFLGTGTTDFTLTSIGQMQINDQSSSPLSDGGADKVWNGQSALPGQLRMYRVEVPAGGLDAIEVLLKNRSGKPAMLVERAGLGVYRLPTESSDGELDYSKAVDGGYVRDFVGDQVITIPYAQAGNYAIAVGVDSGSTLAAGYDVQVSAIPPESLAFDGGQDRDVLVDNQIRYYKVVVPATVDGSPLLGWQVSADLLAGGVELRVRKGFLPTADTTIKPVVKSEHNEAVIAAPLLTPGIWYIEVKATADGTDYTVKSKPVRPERSWTLPVTAADFTHPGLVTPMFGDSGVATDGSPIINPTSLDQGTDLKAGQMHFYKVTVPAGNAGLLRTALEALSGYPELYIRRDGAPTLDHDLTGNSSYGSFSLYDLADEDANSSFGHWTALDARESTQLAPGTWWIGVFANKAIPSAQLFSNARYRLKLSVGNVENGAGALVDNQGYVQDLSADPAVNTTYSNQTLAEGDIRYYRLKLPQSSVNNLVSTPSSWTITLTGNINLAMRIRDTAPVGMASFVPASFNETTGSNGVDWRDWKDENEQTSATSHGFMTGVGTRTLTIPELKPGATYYVAVRATLDIPVPSPFTITSSVSASRLPLDGVVDFFAGSLDINLPAGASRLYRVDVPALAGVWQHTATHDAEVKVYVQQGTVSPQAVNNGSTASTNPKHYNDWSSVDGFGNRGTTAVGTVGASSTTGANSGFKMSLYQNTSLSKQSPWLAGKSYYITVVNTAPTDKPFKLVMIGDYLSESDADGDGMPDSWEVDNFGTIANTPTGDADGDGLNNLKELQAGTDPMDADTDDDGAKDGADAFPLDPNESLDSDTDGIGNNADPDDDNDGIMDAGDNCHFVPNPLQADVDSDGVGNACQTAIISFETGVPAGWVAASPGWVSAVDEFSHLTHSLRAAPITASQTASISWKESFAAGNVVFDVKVSSQQSKDYFRLSIDGVNASGTQKSGDTGWVKVTVPVTAGIHTLTWTYTKDATVDTGSDTAWLDYIRYTQGEDAGDTDGDGIMDFDDTDDDNDGTLDVDDAMPKDPTEVLDTDGDGIGNNADPDDDNDGIPDALDPFPLDSVLWAVTEGSAANAGVGSAVAFAGDVDNDGFGDVVVGAYKASPVVNGITRKGAGAIRVISGKTGGLITALSVPGVAAGDGFGFSVAGVGDVNADNHADIAVGAPAADHLVAGKLVKDTGSITVLSGATGGPLFTEYGVFAADKLGSAVTGVGDTNGTATAEVFVAAGAPLADKSEQVTINGVPKTVVTKNLGSIRLYNAATGALLTERFGLAVNDNFGAAVAAAGDVNGDGSDDVLVGAPLADKSAQVLINNVLKTVVTKDVGHVQLLSGAALTAGTAGAMQTLEGEKSKDGFGRTVAGNADVNNDTLLDILVGAPLADSSAVVNGKNVVKRDVGRIYLYTASNGVKNAITREGAVAGDQFGAALSLVKNLDGVPGDDFVVGAPKADRFNPVGTKPAVVKDVGLVAGYSGSTGNPLFSTLGKMGGDYWGAAVNAGGDINNDGFSDIIVGAWSDDIPTVSPTGKNVLLKNAGRVDVLSGKAAVK